MPDPTPRPTPLLEALAQVGPFGSPSPKEAEREVFRLRIGGLTFAVDAGLIQEVVRVPPITPLPGAPAFLVGVAAHRGDVVAIVDVARLLDRGDTKVGDRSRMAVARADGMMVALLAEEIVGLARILTSSVQPPPLGSEDSEFIAGVCMGPEPMNLLDLRRALATARERASARR
jgi:purine-binding chemotaxis protein CheW